MKKIKIILLTMFFPIALCACVSLSSETPIEPDEDIIIKIEQTIILFYENKDCDKSYKYADYVDEKVVSYLNQIIDKQSSIMSKRKQNYSILLVLKNKKHTYNELELYYQVVTKFNYVQSPNIETTVSDDILIIYNYDLGLITLIDLPFYD